MEQPQPFAAIQTVVAGFLQRFVFLATSPVDRLMEMFVDLKSAEHDTMKRVLVLLWPIDE